ncbi:abortive infection bacteriophage resistance protein [Kineosphaera limosa]|uniref:Abi family protein n=1 Tax=Kineosphaera limosa NBRC 100340 TaxID=1184609 RepID=K6WT14_9MICO|nr:Abi family protein [Kineosphaera limosa]NYE00844.1 abortive infection bacteriophage resistance protein [Kineosphaera limosa]GAB96971.1 hypothetical protein KILIM_053_00220 [Kineosphaera limosa NBRC 100340]
MSTYEKPHLTYAEQVDRLSQRGLEVREHGDAERVLASVGYYHLSAFMYPYRQLLPEAEQRRQSPVHYRGDRFQTAATFDQVTALYEVDRRLRLLCLDALGQVEIGLRTRATYVLGDRNAFGHIDRSALDPSACDRPGPHGRTAFELWTDRCTRLQHDARNEDFIRHVLSKYGEPLPVWVAVETFDFGALVRLLGLMRGQDLNHIAGDLGIKHARVLVDVTRALNLIRNICAHHGRLWNRQLVYGLRNYQPAGVSEPLRHVARGGERNKVYPFLVWLVYLTRQFSPGTTVGHALVQLMEDLRETTGRTPEHDMGFPVDWRRQQVWRD